MRPHEKAARGFDPRQLEWIHRNRQPRSRTATLSSLLPKLIDTDLGGNVRHRALVRQAIAECVDDTFREACTLGATSDSSVTILVEHPAMIYALRMTWCFQLVEHLERCCRFRATPKIVFQTGKSPDHFNSV